MSYKIYPFVVGAFLSLGGVALADDAPSAQPVKTPKQKMHECMAQERASNSAMSKDDMKKACAAKLQSDENHPSRPQPSPDSSHN
jgi:pentapeptide MXKDX repeat protein